MNKKGPIIVIEDDPDDQEILAIIFQNLAYENKIHFFSEGEKALDFINQSEVVPFLILSDINMPKLNGFEIRKLVFDNQQLALKCIPYLFFTTGVSQKAVIDAYSMSVQGFFRKPSSMNDLEATLKKIIEYWQECFAPNQYDEK